MAADAVVRGQHERQWLLEQPLDDLQELRTSRPVDGAMIAGQCHFHAMPNAELSIHDHRLLLDGAHRQNGGFRRVDDGAERLDIEHPQVRDAERAPV